MGEPNADELIRTTLDRRTEELRTVLAVDLETAGKHGVEAGKAEGFAEGELRGSKKAVIRVSMNLLRAGIAPAVIAEAAELPELIIRKLAQDNGIEIA